MATVPIARPLPVLGLPERHGEPWGRGSCSNLPPAQRPGSTPSGGRGTPDQVNARACASPLTPGRLGNRIEGKRRMRNRVFHQARIADIIFEGVVTASGLSVLCQTSGVALGVSGLRQFQPEVIGSRRPPPAGWWVVKYYAEERIFLPDFDRAAIRDLSDEFGLVMLVDGETDPAERIRQDYFFTSPAWDGLRRWVTRHPRLAKACAADDPYLPRWYEQATIEAERRRFRRTRQEPHGADRSAAFDRPQDRQQGADARPRRPCRGRCRCAGCTPCGTPI